MAHIVQACSIENRKWNIFGKLFEQTPPGEQKNEADKIGIEKYTVLPSIAIKPLMVLDVLHSYLPLTIFFQRSK